MKPLAKGAMVEKRIKALLIVGAVYLGLVGLGLVFVPREFGLGAIPADASPALIAFLRLLGGPLLGIAALNWSARNSEASTARRAIVLGNIVGFTATAALDVWGLFHGARAAAKIFVVIHFVFALAFIGAGRKSIVGTD